MDELLLGQRVLDGADLLGEDRHVGPVDRTDVPVLAEQIRTVQDPLPEKQLVHRRVADVAANTDDVQRASVDSGTLAPVSLEEGSA